jgi:hypothetical protein
MLSKHGRDMQKDTNTSLILLLIFFYKSPVVHTGFYSVESFTPAASLKASTDVSVSKCKTTLIPEESLTLPS